MVGLRRLLKIKNKELRHMKDLASTILSQRNETEQFFLESLQEVKEIIRRQKKRSPAEAQIILNKMRSGGGANVMNGRNNGAGRAEVNFPPITVKGNNLHLLEKNEISNMQSEEVEKV